MCLWKANMIVSLMEWAVTLNDLKDMIAMTDGMKDCAYLGMHDVNDIFDEIYLNRIYCILNFLKWLCVWNNDVVYYYTSHIKHTVDF